MEPPRAGVRRAATRFVRARAMVVTGGLAVVIGAGVARGDPLSAPAQPQPKPRHAAPTSTARHPPGSPIIPPAPVGPPPLARAPLPLDLDLLPGTAAPAASSARIAVPAGTPAPGS